MGRKAKPSAREVCQLQSIAVAMLELAKRRLEDAIRFKLPDDPEALEELAGDVQWCLDPSEGALSLVNCCALCCQSSQAFVSLASRVARRLRAAGALAVAE